MEKYNCDGQATDDNIKWRMLFACWISKATYTHSEYVIVFISFPPQQLFLKRAQMFIRTLCVLLSSVIAPSVLRTQAHITSKVDS